MKAFFKIVIPAVPMKVYFIPIKFIPVKNLFFGPCQKPMKNE